MHDQSGIFCQAQTYITQWGSGSKLAVLSMYNQTAQTIRLRIPTKIVFSSHERISALNYIVTAPHRSEYPEPITFKQGSTLIIGDKYDGPEAWDNWYFCTVPGHTGGWVPAQVIEWTSKTTGVALEDYTARELDIDAGAILHGTRQLNGWVWCTCIASAEAGWVPLANIQNIEH
jgi:hypothetical protein